MKWNNNNNNNNNRTTQSRKIRKFGEKKNYNYLGILEAEAIKKVETKEEILKCISGETEKNSKPNYIAETSSKV